MTRYIGALDQGTTSTRFIVFDAAGREVARRQLEPGRSLPAGWGSTPDEIAARVNELDAARCARLTYTGRTSPPSA